MPLEDTKACLCGVPIPKDWPTCAKCRRFEALDTLEGQYRERAFRHHALRVGNDFTQPRPETMLGALIGLVQLAGPEPRKRAEEAAILKRRDKHREKLRHALESAARDN